MSLKTLPEILRRALEVLRQEGLKSLWFKILGEIVYRRMVLMERRLDEPIAEISPYLPVTISLLRDTDLSEYIRFRPEIDPNEVRRRLASGQMCFAAWYEGRIIHAAWVATGRAWIGYLAREIALAPDEVYSYESFTAADFRGQNVAGARLSYMQQALQRAGYRRVLAAIMPENKPAFRPVAKTGFRTIGVMGYVRLGPWRWDFIRLQPGARPPGQPANPCGAFYWDNVARQLDSQPHYLDPFLAEMKRQAHLTLVKRWGGILPRGRVLKTDLFEEATGPSAFLTDLTHKAAEVIGIDISVEVVSRAQQRDTNRQAHYVVADVRHLPFADNAFDLIVSPSTLDHFVQASDLDRSLCELARVMEPAGRLIITLDNRQNIFDPLLHLVTRLRKTPYFIGRSYTIGELSAALQAAGLKVQDTTAILHNPRLVATGMVTVANWLRWQPLIAWVRRVLRNAQRLEQTRWCFRTGSFIAALATRDELPSNTINDHA